MIKQDNNVCFRYENARRVPITTIPKNSILVNEHRCTWSTYKPATRVYRERVVDWAIRFGQVDFFYIMSNRNKPEPIYWLVCVDCLRLKKRNK